MKLQFLLGSNLGLNVYSWCELLSSCVFRRDQVSNWCCAVVGRHHCMDSNIPSEPSSMGSHGGLHVLYHTERNPLRTAVDQLLCTVYN